ncbi:MAG: hypothetical protein AB7O44_27380 [Hyphomicrobiaceae bacterium]
MSQLLASCNSVMDELGLARVSTILSGASNVSADPNARRLLSCANRAVQALYKAHDWSVLHREYEFTTEADVGNYLLPDDFGRSIGSTAWDRTTYWRVAGSLTPQQWQLRRSALVSSPATRFGFRALIGSRQASLLLDPVPSAAHSLVIEYVSQYVIENSDNEPFEAFASDFHHVRLDPELFVLGLTWRVRKSYGFPYGDDRADYEAALKIAKAQDFSMPPVNVGGGAECRMPHPSIPEGSWHV